MNSRRNNMRIDVLTDRKGGGIIPYWTKCVGSCHAATALREDWRRQLRICRDAFEFEYVRFHGLLDDDMSVCIQNDDGSLMYSFFNVDSIFDFLLNIGMKPFIELSFMPAALASGTETVFHYRGNITPPRSYEEWGHLIETLARHLVDRYGADEVRRWFFEVWNEPNLDMFWAGSMEEYFTLYRHAAFAIKRVDDGLAVGGPSTAIDAWIPELRAFCRDNHVPLDFISTHHYPTDAAFGLGMDMETQMAQAKRGVLHTKTKKAAEEARPLPLYYTEWNNSPSPRDPYHDTPYNASFIVKTIIDNMGLADGYSFWTFTDIFEEAGLCSTPFHGGFGLLNIHGIPKPSYRAFQMLSQLKGHRLDIAVTQGSPTVDCSAADDDGNITILIANHQIPLSPIEAESVSLHITGLNTVKSAQIERIDETHANVKKAWTGMGSPEYLDDAMIHSLMRASKVVSEDVDSTADGDGITIDLLIQPHSVVKISIEK
jgi:xylan 1,4-beta-xylosidase